MGKNYSFTFYKKLMIINCFYLDYISIFERMFTHMEITDIRIKKFNQTGPMKALVSLTFDNAIAVHDVKVIYARNRYFVVMPSRKNFDGTYRDVVHPINKECRAYLEKYIIDAYMELLDDDDINSGENSSEESTVESADE